jgi:hypothetical protein
MALYSDGYIGVTPAITVNCFGDGRVYYLGIEWDDTVIAKHRVNVAE